MNRIKRIFKGNFTKNVLLITGGTAFAQLINALVSPIITRIYLPEQYGILTIYTSIMSILAIVGSLKFEWGIPIAEDDHKAINVLSLSVIVLFSITTFITIIFIFFGDTLINFFNGEILLQYKFLIPVGVFFTGLYDIFTQWAYRKRNYKAITKTKIYQTITQNIVKISLGFMQFGPTGLIVGNIIGQSSGITTLSMPIIKKERELMKQVNIKNMIWAAKRYKKFPLYSAPGQLLNIFGLQLPVLVITALYGSRVIGLYGLANSIVNIPMNLIGNSIADVFYGEAAGIGKNDPVRLKKLSINLLKKSIIIGLIPLLILSLFGPYLFSLIFGQDWYEAGIYARIISFFVFFRLIFTPITRIFSVYEKQKEALILDFVRVLLILVAFGASKILLLDSYMSVAIYGIVMCFIYLVTYLYAQRILDQEIKKISNF